MMRRSQFRTTSYVVIAVALGLVLVSFGQQLHLDALRGIAATAFEPVQGVMSAAARTGSGFVSTIASIGTVEDENRTLKNRVAALERQLVQARQAAIDDTKLRNMLALRDQLGIHSVGATVIGRDPDGISQVLSLNVGSADGVRKGMVALGQRGLLGRVTSVQAHSSQLQLITDAQSPVNVLLGTSHLSGTVKVTGDRMTVEIVSAPVDLQIPVGDTLVTSGLGGNFPKGLPVAEVVNYKYQAYGVTQVAEVAPLDNPARTEFVTIDLDFVPAQVAP